MRNDTSTATKSLGLLANGSSGRWNLAVEESLDRDEWYLEIETPQTYLFFQLQNLDIISETLRFLQSGNQTNGQSERDDDGITLGRFGSAVVTVLRDNEDFPRFFLVVTSKTLSTLRLNLDAEDIHMMSDALSQVVKDLQLTTGD